jgi:integrase
MSTSRVRRFVNPALGDLAVADLTRERCEQWYAALCPDHPAQRTRTYAALNTILHLAVDRGLISSSPLRVKGALDDIPLREPQTASVGQVDALAAAMPAHLAMAVHLAAWCGLRAGEVLGLQRGDVTADSAVPASGAPVVRLALRRHLVHGRGTGGMKIVPGAKSDKRAATVVVPPHLVPPLHAHLDAHAGPSPTAWLFPSTRNRESPCAPTALHRHWDHARTKTKLTHLTFHDLRRTGNTLAAESGATPGEMKERLRHRTSKAAERYIVSAQGADVRLAARMSERLAPAVDPVEAEVQRRVAERLAELGIEP